MKFLTPIKGLVVWYIEAFYNRKRIFAGSTINPWIPWNVPGSPKLFGPNQIADALG